MASANTILNFALVVEVRPDRVAVEIYGTVKVPLMKKFIGDDRNENAKSIILESIMEELGRLLPTGE